MAIATTGRYFNRLGPRPLIAVGCLLQAVGIVTLAGVNAHTANSMLIAAFVFMGAGGSLCSSTAQSSQDFHGSGGAGVAYAASPETLMRSALVANGGCQSAPLR